MKRTEQGVVDGSPDKGKNSHMRSCPRVLGMWKRHHVPKGGGNHARNMTHIAAVGCGSRLASHTDRSLSRHQFATSAYCYLSRSRCLNFRSKDPLPLSPRTVGLGADGPELNEPTPLRLDGLGNDGTFVDAHLGFWGNRGGRLTRRRPSNLIYFSDYCRDPFLPLI